MKKVIIIGGGIGGLATANLLARDGFEVHVYEQGSTAGGRAGMLRAEGFTFDTGPSWYLMPEVFERYYKELGETIGDHLDIVRLDPSYKVFFENDTAVVISGDIHTDAATFEAIEQGSGAALERYAARADELYGLALRYFLYTDFAKLTEFLTPAILKRLPQMAHLMLTPIHRYIAGFVHSQRLQQILEYPMVFLGTSPFQAPALYSLMGALDFKQGVYYPRGGIYTIIQSLESIGKSLGVTYHYDSPVSAIECTGKKATGIRLENGESIAADIVVSNADIHYTETELLPVQAQSYSPHYWKKLRPSSSALLLYLGVRGEVPELKHHNLLFVDAWRENFDALYTSGSAPQKASLYLSKTSATDPKVAPEGHETLFVLVPLPPNTSFTDEEVEGMTKHYIQQIETMTGVVIADRIVYQSAFTPDDFGTKFHSWKNAMLGPSHVLSQSAFWRTKPKSKRLDNLYYVGAGTLPGIGMPMCLIGAQTVAKTIREAVS